MTADAGPDGPAVWLSSIAVAVRDGERCQFRFSLYGGHRVSIHPGWCDAVWFARLLAAHSAGRCALEVPCDTLRLAGFAVMAQLRCGRCGCRRRVAGEC